MQIRPIIFLALMGCTTDDTVGGKLEQYNQKANEWPATRTGRPGPASRHQGEVTAAMAEAASTAQAEQKSSRPTQQCEAICSEIVHAKTGKKKRRKAKRKGKKKRAWETKKRRRLHFLACEYTPLADAGQIMAAGDPDAVVGNVDCATYIPGKGRPPMGTSPHRSTETTLGAHHASDAREEAASVYAFLQLKAQLAAMGAPEALLERCAAATQDEVVHTQMMAELARAAGSTVQPVDNPGVPRAQPQDIAAFNAMTGCVAESFSALLAAWQAEHASDPELQSVYAQIATDELEHAQLSWDIHAWLMGEVDDPARVQAALEAALLALPEQAAQMTRPDLPELGLPNAHEMAALSQSFVRGIQSQFAA